MKDALIAAGYAACWALSASNFRRTASAWCWVWYRYFCPYPTNGFYRARDCARCNNCGCNNGPRYRQNTTQEKT